LLVMRKQQQAPGELELVRAFVNTLDVDRSTEQLDSAAALGDWLSEHRLAPAGVSVSRAQLGRATELREAIRSLLIAHRDDAPEPAHAWRTLDAAATRAKLALRFDPEGRALLEPGAHGVDGALGRLLAIVHTAIARDTWQRLKACRLETCQWAFFDHTKNRSGTWCTMEVCGNRAKARAYRERRAGERRAGTSA
jgi:predicted RNA-binding Zn ribbon-like protein